MYGVRDLLGTGREKGGVVFGLNQLVDDYNHRVGWKLRVE